MEIAHSEVSASWSPWQIGRTTVSSIPPRMNMSCPIAVNLKRNTTVRWKDPGSGVVVDVVEEVVVDVVEKVVVDGVVEVVDVDPSAID